MAQVTTSHPEPRWASDADDIRAEIVRLGLWMFLGTVTMLFAAFTSAYIVRRSGSDWRPIALPPQLWLNTAALALSSAALEGAQWWGQRGQWRAARVAGVAAAGLGTIFLGGQWIAWRQLSAAGVYLPTTPHSSFFYMMTAAHGVHAVAALALLAWTALATGAGAPWRRRRSWGLSMSVCRTFWHYLAVVWVYLFILLSVY